MSKMLLKLILGVSKWRAEMGYIGAMLEAKWFDIPVLHRVRDEQ